MSDTDPGFGEQRAVDESIDNLAPPNQEWHMLYATIFWGLTKDLAKLQDHPSFAQAEDLGDWVETISTLTSFRPRTRNDYESEAYEMVYALPYPGE
jgi:hypothetical protein